MSNETHIASAVIQVWPEKLQQITRWVADLPGTEIHTGAANNKFIAVFETGSTAEIQILTDRINQYDGVLTVNLVYHHHETPEELAEEIDYEIHSP